MDKKDKLKIMEYFAEVELSEEYKPYFCSVKDAIAIVIIGTFCGFQYLMQIHQWADHEKSRNILSEHFGISHIPCYYWLTRLLKIINPKSMNDCFNNWVNSFLPKDMRGQTVSFDGKTVRSTEKMACFENPLHIVSSQISELGMTFAQEAVEGKSNEIPATQRLIRMLNLKGCVVAADALNCQKETAAAVVQQSSDYILSVKDNQPKLKNDIADYILDEDLRREMNTAFTLEKNRSPIEKRTAFVTNDISWLESKSDWKNLCCIGAVHTEFTTKSGKSSEWHFYISSKDLTGEELLKHVRAEWSVETMHWLLDAHFQEDSCRACKIFSVKSPSMIK